MALLASQNSIVKNYKYTAKFASEVKASEEINPKDSIISKASLDALQTEKLAVDMQFEEWRTKMANLRMERNRYGA